jgi:hypothetical protein
VGSYWQSVLVTCARDDLDAVAAAATALVPRVFRERLTITAFSPASSPGLWSLECSGFREGSVALREPWDFSVPAASLPEGFEPRTDSADLALAQLASRIVGTATWVLYSDGAGMAATLTFEQGVPTVGGVCDDGEETSADDMQDFVMRVFRRYLPGSEYLDDDVTEAFYGEGNTMLKFPVGA